MNIMNMEQGTLVRGCLALVFFIVVGVLAYDCTAGYTEEVEATVAERVHIPSSTTYTIAHRDDGSTYQASHRQPAQWKVYFVLPDGGTTEVNSRSAYLRTKVGQEVVLSLRRGKSGMIWMASVESYDPSQLSSGRF